MNSHNGEVTKISMELKDISSKIQQLQENMKIMQIFLEIRNRTNFGQTEEAYAKKKQIKIIDDELRQLRERQAELQKRLKCMSAVPGRDDQNEEAYSRQRQMNIIGNGLQQLKARLVEQQHTYENTSMVTNRTDQKETNSQQTQMNMELMQLREKQIEPFERNSGIENGDDQEETAPNHPRQEAEMKAPEKKVVFVEAPPSYPAPSVILDTSKLPPEPSRTQCPQCQQFVVTETITSVSSVTWLVCVMTALLGCVAGCCLIPFCSDKFKSITHRCPRCRTSITTLKKL